jgi:D-serine deaminase-like pyridoxal phosphate-dependent protein
MTVDELETPSAVVDLEVLGANVRRLQDYLDRHGVRNRPHVKTHKVPRFARLQIAGGAVGITCQKISEAEVMVEAGLEDILIPYNILGPAKLRRLGELMSRARISVTADSAITVKGLSELAAERETELPVLVEFDTGALRCGVQTPGEAAELAEIIQKSPGLAFAGLMTYPLNEATDGFVRRTKEQLERAGIGVPQVSAGGTHCMWEVHRHSEVTEHRAGMYVYGDRNLLSRGVMTLEQCSFRILSTVVSRPTPERGILDAGSKCLSSDLLGLDGYGLIVEYPEARIGTLSEEHGHVDFSACRKRPEIGERVTLIPNHCCAANNLFNELVTVRGTRVEERVPVEARGTVQ